MDEANRQNVRARLTEHLGHSFYRQRGRHPSRSLHSIAAAVVAILVLTSVARSPAASSCPSRPQYSNARYDDDFSYLRDPSVCKTNAPNVLSREHARFGDWPRPLMLSSDFSARTRHVRSRQSSSRPKPPAATSLRPSQTTWVTRIYPVNCRKSATNSVNCSAGIAQCSAPFESA